MKAGSTAILSTYRVSADLAHMSIGDNVQHPKPCSQQIQNFPFSRSRKLTATHPAC